MSEDCIFCRIVDGEIPARIVHEDDEVVAFLDANPLAPGHTLVVPKAHHGRLRDLPPALSTAVFDAVRTLAPTVEDAVEADANTIAINDGSEAGQEIPHLHVHIVPRFRDDGGGPIHAVAGEAPDLDDDELDAIAEEIRETSGDA